MYLTDLFWLVECGASLLSQWVVMTNYKEQCYSVLGCNGILLDHYQGGFYTIYIDKLMHSSSMRSVGVCLRSQFQFYRNKDLHCYSSASFPHFIFESVQRFKNILNYLMPVWSLSFFSVWPNSVGSSTFSSVSDLERGTVKFHSSESGYPIMISKYFVLKANLNHATKKLEWVWKGQSMKNKL